MAVDRQVTGSIGVDEEKDLRYEAVEKPSLAVAFPRFGRIFYGGISTVVSPARAFISRVICPRCCRTSSRTACERALRVLLLDRDERANISSRFEEKPVLFPELEIIYPFNLGSS